MPKRKLSWDVRAVSPIIAAILMVAMSVVLTALLFVMVQEMGENQMEITPRASLMQRQSDNFWNITTYIIQTSENIEYKKVYVTCLHENGTTYTLGSTIEGLAVIPGNITVGNITYYKTPGLLELNPSDYIRFTGGYSNEWKGTIIKFVYIPTGGLIVEYILD